MVLQDFYRILDRSGPEPEFFLSGTPVEKYRFSLELNPAHPVYEGHFAGNPVVPGVCQIQMICELLSLITEFPVRLVHSDNVKFMSLMVPGKNRLIEAGLSVRKTDVHDISVSAALHSSEVTFIKFKGVFRQE